MAQPVPTNSPQDELVVRDADGNFKVLRKGKLEAWDAGRSRSPAAHAAAAIPPPPLSPAPAPKAASRFYMDVSDEEEIARYRGTADERAAAQLNRAADRIAHGLIEASGIAIAEEVRPRLARAIVSRLKDVRDLLETREVLMRASSLGGAGLDRASAQELLRRIEDARVKFEEAIRTGRFVETKRDAPAEASPAPEVLEETAAHKSQSPISKPQIITEIPMTKTAVEALTPKPPARPFVHPSYRGAEPGIPIAEQARYEAGTDKESRLPAAHTTSAQTQDSRFAIRDSSQARPQMAEVRATSKLMGPVEELGCLTLEDLRRISPSAQTATDKVREKVELLADESLTQRSKGVSAWKSSPLHQLYLVLGRESMEKGVPIKTLIGEWQKKNRPTLTREEFDAIADLNQKLAY